MFAGDFGGAAALGVTAVAGVGPRRAGLLQRIGITTVEQLLWRVPRRYEDRRRFVSAGELTAGAPALVRGRVVHVRRPHRSRWGADLQALLEVAGAPPAIVVLRWFNAPYMRASLAEVRELICFGRLRRRGQAWEMVHPEWEPVDPDDDEPAADASLHLGRMVPIYPSTEGLSQRTLRRLIAAALGEFAGQLDDPVPAGVRERLRMRPLAAALQALHFPGDPAEQAAARNRLAFTEAYVLSARLDGARSGAAARASGPAWSCTPPSWLPPAGGGLPAAVQRELGFVLTGDQRAAIAAIGAGLAAGAGGRRWLLQADVGAGKTVVALAAMLVAVESGRRAVLMAPTGLLARQHAGRFRRWLDPLGVSVGLAIGGQDEPDRRQALRAALVVGTHALLEGAWPWADVGLVVIDEQHRFGVEQRLRLYARAPRAGVLVMSATPIPRTLARALYGDLAPVLIRELPQGRVPVATHVVPPTRAGAAHAALRRAVEERGEQGFVVFPSIDGLGREGEPLEPGSGDPRLRPLPWSGLIAGSAALEQGALAGLHLGLVHGQMSDLEKAEVMAEFEARRLDILCGTTVVEVGVDLPHATEIVIEHADRFGLAQLHQLRGRVGRGGQPGECWLVARSKDALARQRLVRLLAARDGFEVAELDLQLRGPGELAGWRQSGPTGCRVLDLIRDARILELARRCASEAGGGA